MKISIGILSFLFSISTFAASTKYSCTNADENRDASIKIEFSAKIYGKGVVRISNPEVVTVTFSGGNPLADQVLELGKQGDIINSPTVAGTTMGIIVLRGAQTIEGGELVARIGLQNVQGQVLSYVSFDYAAALGGKKQSLGYETLLLCKNQ